MTAGPTHEAIDPVRFISNNSSGKMGISIAEELAYRGANVTLVLGPSDVAVNRKVNTIRVTSAIEMYEVSMSYLPGSNIIIMAAAVADYAPEIIADQKIKKEENSLTINLKKTNDILESAGKLKKEDQILVGFALETSNEKENALKKLIKKNADMIILNSLNDKHAGFQFDTNKITIFDKLGKEYAFENKSKKEVAKDIVNTIIQYKNV